MFDAFPYDEWSEDIAGFWTFGPESSTGTYILTALGIAVMLIAFAATLLAATWMVLARSTRHASR